MRLPRRTNVTRLSRDYRRPPRWGMGLPPRRPVAWWHHIADPRFYLRAVIVMSALALVAIPLLADATLAGFRPIEAGNDRCRVLHVVDGDTADIWCSRTGVERVRLTGYDAPELFSPRCTGELLAAQQAKWALRAAMLGTADLRMHRHGLDRYGRRLVTLWLGADPLSRRMIAEGHARPYGGGQRSGWC